MPVSDSVLDTVKSGLGLAPNYTAFDTELIMHINSVFGTIQQLGAGPDAGFAIEDSTATWTDFSDQMLLLAPVRSFVFITVKMIFDPPVSTQAMIALKDQAREYTSRINWAAEQINPPSDPIPVNDDVLAFDLEIEKGWFFGDL